MSTASTEPHPADQPARVRKTGRNKPRARLVCANCRSRKIKCDAEKLSTGERCSHCVASELPCVLNPNYRRRGRPSHQSISILQDRMEFLETALKETTQVNANLTELQQQRPEAIARDESLRNDRAPSNGSAGSDSSPQLSAPVPFGSPRVSGDSNNERRLSFMGSEHEMIADNGSYSQAPPNMTEACRFRSENYAPRRDHGSSHASFSPNTTREPRPPSRDTENAKHFTYYGPTTQPHIHSPSNDLITNGAEDDIAPNIPLNMDSIPLRKALIELFFKLQTRFITLVNEQLFMTDWALQKRSQYYSSFLEDAILAFSARHSTSSAMRKLRDKYTTRCKSKIIMELEDPNIAYLQGLLLLGDCETTRGRPRTGWTYCIMATGVMVDLGIHIDSSHLVERGSITAEEAKARKDLLLSTFVYAAQWSLYLGRPLPISQVTLHATQQAVSEVSSPWVIFCMSMLDIMDILNGPTSVSGFTRETADRLLELNSSLRSLSDSAQSNFSSEKIQLGELDAEMYSFHMQCCGLQILVHRALLKPLPAQGQSDCTQARHSLSESAKEQLYECVHENAIRIGQLVASYLRIFGVDEIVTVMVDNIFIAAVTLITHAHRLDQKGQSDVQSIQWLKFLSNTIRDMQKHFPTTSRMQSCLSKMVEGSSLAFIFPPISASSPSAPHNGLDLLFAQGNTLDVPRLDVNNVSADANQFDFSNLMSAPGTGPFTYEALWNMSPAMFESTAEPFGLSR